MAKLKTRGQGEGSIYYSESEGSWVAQVEAGTTKSGARRYLRRYRPTKTAAKDALGELLRLQARNIDPALARQPIKKFLARWLEDVEDSRAPKTVAAYRADINHVVEHVGGVRLDKLTPRHVRDMLRSLHNEGLAPKTVLNVRTTLHTAIEQAVNDQVIDWNPVSVVDRPKVDRDDVTPLTPQQARDVLASLEGHYLYALYAVALAVGLRLGEALGLRWSDVDLDAGVLKVRLQLQRVELDGLGRHYVLRDLKSKKSKADIPLPAFAVRALAAHRKEQAEQRLKAGPGWVGGCCDECGGRWDLVFTTPVVRCKPEDGEDVGRLNQRRLPGRPVHPTTALNAFKEACEQVGAPPARFHDLRHTAATLLLAMGVPVAEVQEILRHSSIQVTKDIYGHLEVEHLRGATDKMDGLLGG